LAGITTRLTGHLQNLRCVRTLTDYNLGLGLVHLQLEVIAKQSQIAHPECLHFLLELLEFSNVATSEDKVVHIDADYQPIRV
jgi:hypothetical protein